MAINKDKIQEISFQIISLAGTAYERYYTAIQYASEGNYIHAHEILLEGNKIINEAHMKQTELLVAESRGETIEFSIILIHAQDHLMNTISFSRIAKQFIKLYEERSK